MIHTKILTHKLVMYKDVCPIKLHSINWMGCEKCEIFKTFLKDKEVCPFFEEAANNIGMKKSINKHIKD